MVAERSVRFFFATAYQKILNLDKFIRNRFRGLFEVGDSGNEVEPFESFTDVQVRRTADRNVAALTLGDGDSRNFATILRFGTTQYYEYLEAHKIYIFNLKKAYKN